MSYEPLGQGLWYFLTSFVGTLGFAILLHAPKRAWLPASLIGAMTYTLYWSLKQLSLDEAASMFLAALFGSLLAQFCARKMRMIATIFLLLSVVALVPGLGLYRCMEQLGHQQYALGAQTGILTMAGILMMRWASAWAASCSSSSSAGRRKSCREESRNEHQRDGNGAHEGEALSADGG